MLFHSSQLGRCALLKCYLARGGVKKCQKPKHFLGDISRFVNLESSHKNSKFAYKIDIFWLFLDTPCFLWPNDMVTMHNGQVERNETPFAS